MSVFSETQEKLLKYFLGLKETDWVEWIAQPNDWQDDCDKFDGCYFCVKSMPAYPQHPHCQCILNKISQPIPNVTAFASCDIRKFTEYIFNEAKKDGKMAIFENMGFNFYDSQYLQQLFLTQALEKYCNGDYKYKGVGKYFARIEIVIDIPTATGTTKSVKTGWSLQADGKIILATPFSGWAK